MSLLPNAAIRCQLACRDREWWRAEARRCGTDWSTLLRQRIRVLAWVRAGRPRADTMSEGRP
jgi:hypothetical protein